MIEAVLAVAALTVVAVLAGGQGGSGRADGQGGAPGARVTSPGAGPTPPGIGAGLSTWSAAAVPLITGLVDDLTAAERDTGPGSLAPADRLALDGAALGRDAARARTLANPPDPALAGVWSGALDRIDAELAALQSLAAAPPNAATATAVAVAAVHAHLAAAGDLLIELGQALQSG